MTSSSSALNHLGITHTRNGINAIIRIGNPIAAIICEMATVAATVG
jgi:hypothetical protein